MLSETSDIKQFQFNPWSEEIVEDELQDKAHTKAKFLEVNSELNCVYFLWSYCLTYFMI